MSQIDLGSNLLSFLFFLGLLSLFILTLGNTISSQEKHMKREEMKSSLLKFHDYSMNGNVTDTSDKPEPGLIEYSKIKDNIHSIESFIERETEIFIKIRSLDEKYEIKSDRSENGFEYSVSLPAVLESERGIEPGRIVLKSGGKEN